MIDRLPKACRRFVLASTSAGLAVFSAVLLLDGAHAVRGSSAVFWVLAAALVVGEIKPLQLSENSQVATSTTFALAILIAYGAAAAVVAQAVASLVADLIGRTAAWKTIFNIAQYTLSLASAGAVLAALAPNPAASRTVTLIDVLAMSVAACVFHILNVTLSAVALALRERGRPAGFAWNALRFHTPSAIALLALAPVVVFAAQHSFMLLPLVILQFVAIHRNTRVSVEKERRIQHQRLHDSLTGLANRVLLRDSIEEAVSDGGGRGVHFAVVVVNLDRFKDINDTLGAEAGDFLLQQIAERLDEVRPVRSFLARLGGDSFALLMRDEDTASTRNVAKRITAAVAEPVQLQSMILDVEVSVGAAMFPDHGSSADELLLRAEGAMFEAKRIRSGFEMYNEAGAELTRARLVQLGDLRRSVLSGRLSLVYQPVIDIASGATIGVEALLRWDQPGAGYTPPGDLMPLAEQTGLMKPLTRWVLGEAIREWKKLHGDGFDLTMSVNVSVRNLKDPAFPREVMRMLAEEGVPPRAMTLEITESMLMGDDARAIDALDVFRSYGIALSLDDFGTGYSSLAHIQRLPVSEVKIDQSFVTTMKDSDDAVTIIRSTIDLGHNLGLAVVAEGVEDAQTLDLLTDAGCDRAQGYHMSRPLTAFDLREWLTAHSQAHATRRLAALA